MPTIDSQGRRLHVEDTGGDGPPIVFSLGRDHDATMFARQVAELRPVYRCITWGRRDADRDVADAGPSTLWDAARDLFVVLDVIGIERAVLCGVGQGAEVSLRAGLLHPDRVRALLLFAVAAWDHPDDDLTPRFEELSMSVLCVRGSEDDAAALDRARRLCGAATDCRGLVEVAGSGATVTVVRPDLVHPVLQGYLESLPA